jgi:hypothetical protein
MTSRVFELALFIRPDCGAIDEGIVFSIKEGVSKNKQCHMQKSEIKE